MKTILEQPLLAMELLHLCEAGRITKELLVEAMSKPKVASFIVAHEAMHDYFRLNPESLTEEKKLVWRNLNFERAKERRKPE